jgi:hypothetical protein
MVLDKGRIAWLLIAWAFYLSVGGTIGLTLPFVLLVLGTIVYLIP